jgi:tRNA U34 5-methylaminomethyl-2-thiouridine-forming methyltransferase MnmC
MKNDVDQHNLAIKLTPDGSYTIHNAELNESYHSEYGALTESNYVFIENGLATIRKEKIHVFEMGFGTGLNAFLAWKYAQKNNTSIHYTSIEIFPLSPDFLPIPSFIQTENEMVVAWNKIQQSEWNKDLSLDESFTLCKQHAGILDYEHNALPYDIIFYDAFAPSVQPELWTEEVFTPLFNALNPEGILVTYSSAGAVKRALMSAGFILQRLSGPPGKKHMLRAIKKL